ncbi:MAG TPA: hypothetical protein VMH87_03825 [Pseudomonadales bacterium]|nr:hypothetical protein [Pseudomonadales bacterium]
MTPESAKEEFEDRIKRSGVPISHLTPGQGMCLMLDYFKGVRADDCEADDGDMLLFQWGTNNWGGGPSFQFNLTRQFIKSHGEDEDDDAAISQLSFTFHFTPSAQFDAMKSGNRWCRTLDELPGFEAFITSSDVYQSVQALRPVKVTLDYFIAG